MAVFSCVQGLAALCPGLRENTSLQQLNLEAKVTPETSPGSWLLSRIMPRVLHALEFISLLAAEAGMGSSSAWGELLAVERGRSLALRPLGT